jgi:hypothetical protein
MLKEKDVMEKELVSLRQKSPNKPVTTPPKTTGVVIPSKQTEPTVKAMGAQAALKAGLPMLTTYPNVVTGIVKDFASALLPGVLVTVKDKEGVPLRALKTNKLGQFAASTPLANGVYLIEVEDPRNRFVFDKAQITLTGAVMPTLQIIAKSQKELEREQLHKQIFGTPNASV